MATITDTLLTLAQDIRDAIAAVRGIETRLTTKFGENTNNVTTIINNFNARPLFTTVYVDPGAGLDTNDGLSLAKPKRTLDAVLGSLGSQGVSIILLADDTIKLRHNVFTNVFITGAQRSAAPAGYSNLLRTVTYLGEAENSPSVSVGTMSSGFFFAAGALFTANINHRLPIVPAGLNNRAHIMSSSFVNAQLLQGTIFADGAGAAALFGSFNGGRSIITFSGVTLGTNAPGHVFDGIAAGADPNANWAYQTNLKAA